MGVPINNVTRRVVYAASGTGPYNFTFEILAAADIAVYRDDTLLTLTTNYTVTINSNGTGFVTLTATPTGATQIAIVGNRTISRTTDFVTGGDFFANTLNDELDQQTIFNQQNAEGLQRALIAPQTDPTTIDMTLPRAVDRANKTLAFDANGDPTLGISAADVANAVTYATNAANSATAAASSASAASSSASSASSSASTATTQASNASTSATNAANSASAASTSATNAASSASTAATQASNASTSATNAASSASAASTSASNASTSATNASNSASAAATSASNAATSETNAANSASAAAASAASAANTFDSFDDRYLGTKSSNPTLDNDGNALVAGALYFSTSENIMKVYDGASWIAATSAGNVSFLRFRYVATAGQTSFSGADSNAATLSYTVNNIVVFLNGVSLDQTEYTATSGTSVVLTTGAALNDELVIVAFKSFVTADMVPASTGGTYAGAVRFVAGSASVPSISVDGDTNTGIFYPAADTIAFAEGGAEVARFDSAGNFGIGTTSPGGKFNVDFGNFAGVGARFQYNSSNTPFCINALNSNGAAYIAWNAAAKSSSDTATRVLAQAATKIEGGSGLFIFYNTASSTAGSDITWSERMRLDASGDLGVGTASPSQRFDAQVATGTEGSGLAVSNSEAGGYGSGVSFYSYRTDGTTKLMAGQVSMLGAASWSSTTFTSSHMLFKTVNQNTLAERARITSGGDFCVGKTAFDTNVGFAVNSTGAVISSRSGTTNGTSSYDLYSTGASAYRFYVGMAGTVFATNTTISAISDVRHKENIRDLDVGLAEVMQLQPRVFDWKEGKGKGTQNDRGFIAQEFEQVFPDLIDEWKDPAPEGEEPYKAVRADLIPVLVKAIQELNAKVEAQAAEIAALKAQP